MWNIESGPLTPTNILSWAKPRPRTFSTSQSMLLTSVIASCTKKIENALQLWRRKCPNLHTSQSAIAFEQVAMDFSCQAFWFFGGFCSKCLHGWRPRHRRDGITSSTACKTTTYAWWSWCSWRLNLHWGCWSAQLPDGSMPKCGSHFAPSPILNPAATANAIDELRHGHTSPTWMWCRATPCGLV